ncbi:hypothetical protein L1D58_25550, partial [Vibrio diabolicus]|uniref:hypothetical protein n=1 Tax=Vibrio diabolicus TaxID=50719 RepID=UPI00211B6B6A
IYPFRYGLRIYSFFQMIFYWKERSYKGQANKIKEPLYLNEAGIPTVLMVKRNFSTPLRLQFRI